jgi:hypothetical protein
MHISLLNFAEIRQCATLGITRAGVCAAGVASVIWVKEEPRNRLAPQPEILRIFRKQNVSHCLFVHEEGKTSKFMEGAKRLRSHGNGKPSDSVQIPRCAR